MKRLDNLRRLAGNRPLAGLIVANGLSAIGDWLYLTALPVFVLRETGDLGLVGVVAAGRLVPWLLLSMPAGIVADRYPRARVLLASEASRAAQMLLMTVLCLIDAPLWLVLTFALGAVVSGTFAMPAQSGLVPELARDERELGVGNALSSALDNMACVIGPAVAGSLIVVGGLEFAFALNGISFLVVVGVLVALVRTGQGRADTDDRTLTSAPRASSLSWTTIARTAARPLTLDAAISFGAGALSVLPVIVVVDYLRTDLALVGVINVATGIGGVVGAAWAAKTVNGDLGRALVVGIFLSFSGLAATAIGAWAVLAVLAMAASTAGIVLLDVLNTTSLQRLVPEGQLGRAFGLLHTSASLWVMAGCIVPPMVAAHFGVHAAIIAPAALVLVLGALSFAGEGWRSERFSTAAAAA